MADWPAAILTGALYNLVAYRTRSLSSCVLAHAVTNALLGAYVLHTRQWGFTGKRAAKCAGSAAGYLLGSMTWLIPFRKNSS